MLAAFRAFAKSWPAKILLGVLAIAFGIWGIQSGLVPHVSTDVITAGQRSISEKQFRDMVDQQLTRVRQETGQAPTLDQLVKAGAPAQWANDLAQQTALAAWIEQAGIKPDKSLTLDELKQIPNLSAAFNPVTGAFDQKMFRAILQQNGLTEDVFLQNLHDDIASRDLATAIQAGTQTPNLYTAVETTLMMQTRDASFFQLNARALGPLPTPTEADLQKIYHDLGDRVRRQETRALTLVVFDPRKVAETVTVDPAEVRKVFDFRKDTYSTPEKRTFVSISAKDAQGAAKIDQALRSGQSPEAAAKGGGGQVTAQTDAAKTSVPDAKVADVVFSMKPGQISDVIHGDLGFAVVKLQSVTPGRPASFEEKRPEIEQALRLQGAKDKVNDMVQKYSEAIETGTGAAEAAAKVGALVNPLPPMTADGQSYAGGRINVTPNMQKVLQTGFSLAKGGKSEPQQLQGGGYYAVQVSDIRPAYKPSLDEIRSDVANEWTRRTLMTKMKAKSDELLARLRKGEPIAQVAASVHAQVQPIHDVQRTPAQSADPRSIITSAIFNAQKGQPFAAPFSPADVFIGQVDEIHPPATIKAAEVVAGRGRAVVSRTLTQDLLQGVKTGAHDKIKPKVDQKNLAASLGQTGDQGAPAQ